MPGCQQRASLDSLSLWFHGGGSTHGYSWQVPPLVLLGVDIYTASVAFSNMPMNPLGAVSSNGIRGEIGTN
jgi:hypothetical protein